MSDWAWSQANRFGQITTELDTDKIFLTQFTATERLSEPFTIVVDVVSEELDLDFESHLGSNVHLAIGGDASSERDFNGVLFEAARIAIESGSAHYQLILRPWICLMGLGRNSRIFEAKTAQAIIEKIFQANGFTKYEFSVSQRGVTQREYCTQYRESDLDFVSRLMEEEGLFYYFKHAQDGHTLCICDNAADLPAGSLTMDVVFGDDSVRHGAHLWQWGPRVRPGLQKVTLRDAHFAMTGTQIESQTTETGRFSLDQAEHYDYPGGFAYISDAGSTPGDPYVASLMKGSASERKVMVGEGDIFAITVGAKAQIQADIDDGQFLIVGATHAFGPQSYIAGSADSPTIRVQFEAVPADTDWRPRRRTPKPVTGGLQTATVTTTSAGEVIEVDSYGRVRVQFPWDRGDQQNEHTSCWMRVSQSFADKSFGHMHIPRSGEEVLVDFLEGDPDRPIITGRVYNSANMPPYTLPDEKTKWTWKSQTIGEAGSYPDTENAPSGTGFNELRFDDKGGSEEVFIHAQRDFNAWYRFDETRKTGHNTTVRVGYNRDTSIKNNESLTIEQGSETRTLQQGSRTTTIQQSDTITLKTGDYSLSIQAGQATIEAMQQITLKVGDNKIVISQQGVEITALTVKVEAQTTLALQGLTSDFKAETLATVSGAMVEINS